MPRFVSAVIATVLCLAGYGASATGIGLPDLRAFGPDSAPTGQGVRSRLGAPKAEPASIPGFTIALGARQSFMECWTNQLLCTFPDTPLSFISRTPDYVRLFMVSSPNTWLLEGADMSSLAVVGTGAVLSPGEPGDFDNRYTGVFGVQRYEPTGELLCFYHGEDGEGIPQPSSGIPANWFGLGLAISSDNGATLTKVGPIITSYETKNPNSAKAIAGGVGEGSVVVDKTGTYFYCYYGNHAPYTDYYYNYHLRMTRRLVNAGNAHLARSRIEDKGRPGTWHKYYEGEFSQPGLGGKSEAVAALASAEHSFVDIPYVIYVAEWDRYIMTAAILSLVDTSVEGLYIASSEDGIHWSEFSRLTYGLQTYPRTGVEYISYPCLVLDTVTQEGATGWLYYAYSSAWGQPYQHHLAGQAISFARDQG
jgi:hypothetical protein